MFGGRYTQGEFDDKDDDDDNDDDNNEMGVSRATLDTLEKPLLSIRPHFQLKSS